MKLKFWGTRGSIPVPGKNTLEYGGNTPCVELRSASNELLILDAGSGLRELGKELQNNNKENTINILISHYHWDHIQGMPFFLPLYDKFKNIMFWGESVDGEPVEKILSKQMTSNYFPITIKDLTAKIKFKEVKDNDSFSVCGFKITAFRANHSSPTLAYRIWENDKSIVYMTDNELNMGSGSDDNELESVEKLNKDLVEFCRGCDYLIHDSMYDEATMLIKKGWGHTSNTALALFGILAEVKKLVLFHYNPDYSDKKIDQLLEETSEILKKNGSATTCMAAKEGMEISI